MMKGQSRNASCHVKALNACIPRRFGAHPTQVPGCRVVTIDDYQGEENDVVPVPLQACLGNLLLSLNISVRADIGK